MSDIYDYLTWRGDLTFEASPFNRVDALILSCLSYASLGGTVPEQGIPLWQAAEMHPVSEAMPEKKRRTTVFESSDMLWHQMAETRRFQRAVLHCYVNDINPLKEQQFSAVTVDLGQEGTFVSFRGTDNTLIGWKEDFNMACCQQVAAQRQAYGYLEMIAARTKGKLRAGGHSKGGNLAIYSASYALPAIQRRMTEIYNFDGPGFSEGALDPSGYQAVRGKIRTVVPESSVVGMLLEHEKDYTVVRSTEFGIRQHDPFSWQLKGPDFECLNDVDELSRFVSNTLDEWISGQDMKHREQFVDALFEVLSAVGDEMYPVGESGVERIRHARAILTKLTTVDRETRVVIFKMLGYLLKAAQENMPDFIDDVRARREEEELLSLEEDRISFPRPGSSSAER